MVQQGPYGRVHDSGSDSVGLHGQRLASCRQRALDLHRGDKALGDRCFEAGPDVTQLVNCVGEPCDEFGGLLCVGWSACRYGGKADRLRQGGEEQVLRDRGQCAGASRTCRAVADIDRVWAP